MLFKMGNQGLLNNYFKYSNDVACKCHLLVILWCSPSASLMYRANKDKEKVRGQGVYIHDQELPSFLQNLRWEASADDVELRSEHANSMSNSVKWIWDRLGIPEAVSLKKPERLSTLQFAKSDIVFSQPSPLLVEVQKILWLSWSCEGLRGGNVKLFMEKLCMRMFPRYVV